MEADTGASTPISTLEPTPEAEYERRIANLENTVTRYTTDYFSWRRLDDLSTRLPELVEQFGAVTASCMGECVALGTERGLVVVADYLGRVKTVLGSQTPSAYGAVSSVAFSADYLSLVAGYSVGYVVVWDWGKGTTVSVTRPRQPGNRPESAGHPSGTAITFVHFVGASKHRYISCSAGGYVLYHHIVRRLLTTMSTVQLSSPESSSSILFEAAALPCGSYACGVDDMGLVAILTSASITVLKTHHGAEQLYRLRYQQPSPEGAAIRRSFNKRPYSGSVSWLPALKAKHTTKPESAPALEFTLPMLAYSWGPSIYVLALQLDHSVAENGAAMGSAAPRVKFGRVLEWEAIEDVVFCRWVDADVLLTMTQSQRVFVIEISTGQETEICAAPPRNIAGFPWVTLATGAEAEPSYAQVVSVYKKRVFAICDNMSVYTGRLLTWVERLALLADNGRFIDAITLGTGFYQDRTGQVVVGLPHSRASGDILDNQRRALVSNKLVGLVRASLKHTFESEHSHSLGGSVLSALAAVCAEACIATANTSLLFGEVFDAYATTPTRVAVYLEALEPFILSGVVTYLPPQILNAMVDSYEATPRLVRRLGEMLMQLKLVPGEFDVDRVLHSCRKHQLWRTFARVWLSLGDPIAAITSILAEAKAADRAADRAAASKRAKEAGGIEDEAPGVVVFEYLEMVARGRYYPDGQQIRPQELAEKYSALVVELIFPPVDSSQAAGSIRQTYATLLELLDLGTERFLMVLKHVLSDPFIEHVSLIVKPAARNPKDSERSLRRASQVKSLAQIVVDTLFTLTSSSGSGSDTDSAPGACLAQRQIGLLSSFALTLYATRFPLIFLPDDTVAQWMQTLLRLHDPSTRAEREYAFELLFKLSPPRSYAGYIQETRDAGFFRVLEHIYLALEQYDMALCTYLEHPDYAFHRAVFSAIKELAASKRPRVLSSISRFILDNAVALVEVDADSLVDTVDSSPALSHDTIFHALQDHPQAQLAYLRVLLDPAPESPPRTPDISLTRPTANEREPPDIGLADEQHMVVYPFRSLVPGSQPQTSKYPQVYHERYLELLCRFNPSKVLQHLKQHADLSPEPFRLEYVQSVCEKHGVTDGLVWTLQRVGDFSGALDALLVRTDKEVGAINAAVDAIGSGYSESPVLAETDRERLLDSLDFAARNIDGCINVCKAATAKLGKDMAAQSEQRHQQELESAVADEKAALAQTDYQAQVRSQLCDLWLALLRKVLGYLHGTSRLLDDMAVSGMQPTQVAWQIVSKRQRWMLQNVLDALIFVASPASSLISLRYIIQELMAPALLSTEDRSLQREKDAGSEPARRITSPRSLNIAEIQHLLAVAVSAYKTEAQLMELTNVLVDYDLFTKFAQLVRSQKQGWHAPAGGSSLGSTASSLALAKQQESDLCCSKCRLQLFADLRQKQAVAGRRKQVAQYLESSALRIVDLHVFEDPSAQWQWIKLRGAAATYDEFLSSRTGSRRRAATANSTGARDSTAKRVVLFKCGHSFHWSCLANGGPPTQATHADLECPLCKKAADGDSHNHNAVFL
ncbi:hypothetical protein GQ54DRAFT_295918 [Martensiomyces pterosporus]|nr:hypothetical protein GQ54DRAFT_295918 [Martensiomyces pterosporus]